MTIKDVIKSRRSVRKFKDIPVPEQVINEMLEAARLAPSGGNGQNHIFGIVRDKEIIYELAKAAGNQMWIATAPLVFACCSDISCDLADQPDDDFGLIVNKLRFSEEFIDYLCKYPDREACCKLFEDASPLIPAEHIFLTAVDNGLNACFIGYLDVEKASKILNLPKEIACLYLLPVGYADEMPKQKKTKELEEIMFYDRWTDPKK